MTDRYFHNDADLRYSISVVSGAAGLFATGFLITNIRHYRASIIEADG